MHLYLRLIKTIFTALLGRRIKLSESSVVNFRVWPNDMDFFGNMNNGRFLTLTDLARFDMMIRLGMFFKLLKNKWFPVIVGYHVSYLRPLKRLRSYSIRTELLGWDNRFFYLKHTFVQNNKTSAIILAQTCLRGSLGLVYTADVLSIVDSYNNQLNKTDEIKKIADFFSQSSKQIRKWDPLSFQSTKN